MWTIGFSTGALAFGDFERGLRLSMEHKLHAVELSALRIHEFEPLVDALPRLNLSAFKYVSLHAPSKYDPEEEPRVIELALQVAQRGIPIVVHPDVIRDASGWKNLGSLLLVENMDKRKPIGRSVQELAHYFDLLPEAGFCFDVGHARQFDPSMIEAQMLLSAFGDRLRQMHVSEVNTFSRHERLSWLSFYAIQRVARLIPAEIAVILEAVVLPEEITQEVQFALKCLTLKVESAPAKPLGGMIPVPAAGD